MLYPRAPPIISNTIITINAMEPPDNPAFLTFIVMEAVPDGMIKAIAAISEAFKVMESPQPPSYIFKLLRV